ncbi:hypothetical protein SLS61_008607 [Didymella pomorum]
MAPSKEKGSAVSIRLPMELWWLVIETLAASGEQFELIYLKEVDNMFNALITKLLFQSKAFVSPMRLIHGNTWRSAPASIRERYQFHLLQSRHVNPNLFSDLAAPVFVKGLERLNLAEGQPEADALVQQWCSISMYELWNLSWVVAHNRQNYPEHQARMRRHCQFLSGRWAGLSDTDAAAIKRRTEHDTCFLRIALHIIADEQDAALQLFFPTFFVDPDELNYCFAIAGKGANDQ